MAVNRAAANFAVEKDRSVAFLEDVDGVVNSEVSGE